MNDYAFGNRLCALRRQAGLTQQEAANRLGVTNKAVSKWETGKSKPSVNALTRVETEERLTEKEYLRLLMEADPSRRPIRKTRYCLTYENQYFEIDLYPFWEEEALMEIELASETAPVKLPPFLKILREVTGEEAYTNAALAKA